MWDESVARRGSSEIGSCLYKYITSMNIRSKKFVIFSDNCAGQNKNWNIMALWTYIASTGRFQEIEHYILITGHTYLPTDRDFGKIEKYQQKIENVYSPDHWRKVVLDCGRKNKFIVTAMGSGDFIDLEDLKSNLNTSKDLCDDKSSKVHFSKAVCYKFESSAPLTQ